jgi:uncharacterized membrane protein YidH (DUF202 family)
MIVVMAAISLLLSEWGWRHKRIANFYLAPTRAWELFAGSIAAFVVQKNGVQKNNLLSLLGLAFILFSIFVYDENTPFPSIYTLVPVVGVVLLLLYADKESLAAQILSNKVFVGIGLISYSAYLWHQPLFAFTRIRMLNHPSAMVMILLSLAALALAYLSWKYVERPFRSKNIINTKTFFITSVVTIVLPILIGIFLSSQNLNRKLPSGESFSAYGYTDVPDEPIGYPGCEGFILTARCGHKSGTSIVAWGDSYVKHGIPFVHEYEKKNVAQIALSGCIPFIAGLETPGFRRTAIEIARCESFNKSVMDLIAQDANIQTVVIGSRLNLIGSKTEKEVLGLAKEFHSGLTQWLSEINRPLKVIIFPPPPIPNYDPGKCVDNHLLFNLDALNCNFKVSEFSKFYLK